MVKIPSPNDFRQNFGQVKPQYAVRLIVGDTVFAVNIFKTLEIIIFAHYVHDKITLFHPAMSLVSEKFVEKFCAYKLSCPSTVYYIPHYLSSDTSQHLLTSVYSAPRPKWKVLNNRRLQNWGGLPHPKGMIKESLPPWLNKHCTGLHDEGLFVDHKINHVLINEYTPGQGIDPHVDGPLFTPLIATLNLGSSCLIDFYTRKDEALVDEFSLFLEPGSLLVQFGDVYERYLHGISELCEDTVHEKVANIELCDAKQGDIVQRGTRVSLTIRNVPKVSKFQLRL